MISAINIVAADCCLVRGWTCYWAWLAVRASGRSSNAMLLRITWTQSTYYSGEYSGAVTWRSHDTTSVRVITTDCVKLDWEFSLYEQYTTVDDYSVVGCFDPKVFVNCLQEVFNLLLDWECHLNRLVQPRATVLKYHTAWLHNMQALCARVRDHRKGRLFQQSTLQSLTT